MTVETSRGRLQLVDRDKLEPAQQVVVEDGQTCFNLLAPYEPGDAYLRVTSGDVEVTGEIHFLPDLRPMLAVGIIEGAIHLRDKDSQKFEPVRENDAFERDLRQMGNDFKDGKGSLHGRAAVFLKGKVRGDYLLTLAYDSDKATRDKLFRDIDPEAFYPVYGDSSIKGFDAQSSKRFYVRVDKDRSYLLYGDYTTLNPDPAVSLGQYNRTLTGGKWHYENKRASVTAFAAYDAVRQVVDEFPARGISGPYAVSNANGLVNSEKVEIITRDRNQPSIVLKTVQLQRFTDYEFEPFSGRLLFKQAVPSLDENLNPMSIRVSYEVDQGGEKFWIGGVDGKVRIGERVELGASFVQDENPTPPAAATVTSPGVPAVVKRLASINGTVKLGEKTFFLAEWARSETNLSGDNKGDAARVEVRHAGEKLEARAHAGYSDREFVNPASTLAQGRKEAGGKASYQVTPVTRIVGEAIRSEDELADGNRKGALVSVEHAFSDRIKLEVGMRRAEETSNAAQPGSSGITPLSCEGPTGQSPVGVSGCTPSYLTSGITAGTGIVFNSPPGTTTGGLDITTVRARLTGKITPALAAYVEGEQDIDDSDKRLWALGGEYRFAERGRLYARHEFISSLTGSYGLNDDQRQRATVFGVDANYMKDGEVFSEYRMRDAISGREAQAAMGLRNYWGVAEGLRLNTTLERLHTVDGPSNEATAVALGLDYTGSELWKGTTRLEWRDAETSKSWLSTIALARKMNREWTFLGRNLYTQTESKDAAGGDLKQDRFQLGFAYRDTDTNRWHTLARYEFKYEKDTAPSDPFSRRAHVLSAHTNYQPSKPWIWSGQYAVKRVNERFAEGASDSFTAHLLAGRVTYDITERWDVGATASMLYSPRGSSKQYGLGLEAGYLVMDNLWVSLGYNFTGFRDDDLVDSNYSQRGVYLRMRFKFDEDLFKSKDPNINKALEPEKQ